MEYDGAISMLTHSPSLRFVAQYLGGGLKVVYGV